MGARPLTGIVLDDRFRDHVPGPGHPEQPARYDAVAEVLRPLIERGECLGLGTRAATVDEVCLCHSENYVRGVQREVESGAQGLSTGDTDVCRASYDVALLAVGAGLCAVDSVMRGDAANVFCAVRPPGHHAGRELGMGFCIFNNTGIAARYAQIQHRLSRVLIVDWDVHHGNGTQELFNEDPSVFYFSTHQWPSYPGSGRRSETGSGHGKGYTLNWPVAAGSGGHELVTAFQQGLVPAMHEFQPEFVMVSAGFDARVGDPIGGLLVTDSDYGELTRVVRDIADRYAGGRLVSILEGGYLLDGLASAALAHVRALM